MRRISCFTDITGFKVFCYKFEFSCSSWAYKSFRWEHKPVKTSVAWRLSPSSELATEEFLAKGFAGSDLAVEYGRGFISVWEELPETWILWNLQGVSSCKQVKPSKPWTRSTFIQILDHWVTGDGKLAAGQRICLNYKETVFSLGKSLRQKGGLVGAGLGTELPKTSEERGKGFPHFLDLSH